MAFPKITACIVCEGARAELNNKHILLGYFGVAPDVSIIFQDIKKPIQLCFVFSAGKGAGVFKLELKVSTSDGILVPNSAVSSVEGEFIEARVTSNIFFGFSAVLPKTDRYKIALFVDGAENYSTSVDFGAADTGPATVN
jgi:hypothetical protein